MNAFRIVTNKYSAKRVKTASGSFDSKQEYAHYRELELLERAGEIKDLSRQKTVKLYCNGMRIMNYRTDATYTDALTGKRILWESKGFGDRTWKIKEKLTIAQLSDLGFDEFHVWYKDKRVVHKPFKRG